METKLIMISNQDNVAVALTKLNKGETAMILGREIALKQDIPFGHKVALRDFEIDENIIKYGMPIGHATAFISEGDHVHTHNIKTNLSGIIDYKYNKSPVSFPGAQKKRTFSGYVRNDGRVGIRNEVWIIPTVGCVNQTASILQQKGREIFQGQVDDIRAFTHNMGCSQLTDDHERTQQILKGIVNNPNAGAVLILSLGCENNNLKEFIPVLGDYDKNRVKFLVTQEVEDEYEAGMDLLQDLVTYASGFKREQVGVDKLVVGFKCGGSDAFSGITANALCGRINDIVVKQGGSTILTEVPEMFGAETILMNRTVNEEIFAKTVTLINNFKNYFKKYNQTIYENPSPGNKEGGVSTLEEKSLGCIQKGGLAPVTDVLDYGQQVVKPGLNLLTGPGNDQVSCTNLVASGAVMILFTTGRGNPFGAPVPTVKIASNSSLYERKKNWIDYNAGVVLDGKTLEQAEEELFSYLLSMASGEVKTRNEENDYKEISIFRDGVIL